MTTRYAAFLRAVNLGPHGRISMADLKAAVEDAGFDDVRTLLQSGNVVFTASKAADPSNAVRKAVKARTGLDTDVMARSHAQLVRIAAANPFPDRESQPAKLHVGFLSAPTKKRLDLSDFPEEVEAGSGVLYLWFPNGVGRSKLTSAYLEKQLGVRMTIRNWNTLGKVLASAAESGNAEATGSV